MGYSGCWCSCSSSCSSLAMVGMTSACGPDKSRVGLRTCVARSHHAGAGEAQSVVIFKFALGREQTPFRHRRGKKLFKRKTPSHISPFLAAGGRELLAMPSRQQQSVQLLAPWGHRVHQTRRFCYSREDELELDAAQIRNKDGEEKMYSPTECCVL